VGRRADEIFRSETAASVEAADQAALDSLQGFHRSEFFVERGEEKAYPRLQSRDRPQREERTLDPEPFLQRIAVVDEKGMLAGDPGQSPRSRERYRLEIRHLRAGCDPTCEMGADEALVYEWTVAAEKSHGFDDRHDRGGAGPARRSIDLGIGEDRDIAKVGAVVAWRPGENGAVDPGQPRVERVGRSSALPQSRA